MRSSRAQIVGTLAATLTTLAAIAIFVARSDEPSATPGPSARPATSRTPVPTAGPLAHLVEAGSVGAATTKQDTAVRSAPDPSAPELSRLRAGITLPVTRASEGFLAVLTPCEASGWVARADVELHARADGDPDSIREATIVIDPGHGGQLPGAVGPTGLPEKDPNTEIALRIHKRLSHPSLGARVVLTRSQDITAGLGYRAAIANRLEAHALVSVHNNADPDGPSSKPGSETYYQYTSAGSKRLAGLIYEELRRVLAGYEVQWKADRDAGAKYRLNTRGTDYYALLRGSRVPAVIVEGLYVVNGPEEALLRRSDVLDAVAGAVVDGLTRYFGTDDPGSGFVEPYERPPGPSGRLPSACNEPSP